MSLFGDYTYHQISVGDDLLNGWVMFNLLVRFMQGMDGNGGCGDYHENNYGLDHSLIPDLKHQ